MVNHLDRSHGRCHLTFEISNSGHTENPTLSSYCILKLRPLVVSS